MHRSLLFALALVAVSLGLGGARPAHAAKRLVVVATVGDLGAIAREVLGDAGDVTVLAKPTQDPHFVDARPNLVLTLNRADALVSMGLDYEIGWLPVLVRGARNPKIQLGAPGSIVAGQMVNVRDVPSGKIDRSMGDIHPGGNPHFTLDPRNGAAIARGLGAAFGRLEPELASKLTANAEAFAARADATARRWQTAFAPAHGAPVVTYHRSFVYLLEWLGLSDLAEIEPKPGIPPNAAHVAEVVHAIRNAKAQAIIQERWYPSTVAERIASETGAKLVLIPGMTAEGQRYLDHIDEVVGALAGALQVKPPR